MKSSFHRAVPFRSTNCWARDRKEKRAEKETVNFAQHPVICLSFIRFTCLLPRRFFFLLFSFELFRAGRSRWQTIVIKKYIWRKFNSIELRELICLTFSFLFPIDSTIYGNGQKTIQMLKNKKPNWFTTLKQEEKFVWNPIGMVAVDDWNRLFTSIFSIQTARRLKFLATCLDCDAGERSEIRKERNDKSNLRREFPWEKFASSIYFSQHFIPKYDRRPF